MTAKHLLSEIVADPEDARKMFNEWRALFGMDGPVKVGMVSQPVERLANGSAYVEQLEKALEPFARLEANYRNADVSDAVFAKGCVYVYEIRAAANVLKPKGSRP